MKPLFLRSAHTQDADHAPAEHTQPIPRSRSEYVHPSKRVAASSQRETSMTFQPTLTEPYSGPSASSSLPPEHTLPHPSQTDSSSTHATQKAHNRLNPPIEIRQMKLLIRRMQVVVR